MGGGDSYEHGGGPNKGGGRIESQSDAGGDKGREREQINRDRMR